MKQYSLCLTNYNRFQELLSSFESVLTDPRISEIVISDDASDWPIFEKLQQYCLFHSKIKLFRNKENLGMLGNKYMAVLHAQNPQVILFDSDNVITPDYLNALDQTEMVPDTLYLPEFAKPQFDYRSFSGRTYTAADAKTLIATEPMFNCMLNTCNYAFLRETYLRTWQPNESIKGTDTLWVAYLWLKSGLKIYVVPRMQYLHVVHAGSGWLADSGYNTAKAQELNTLIGNL